MSLCYPGTKWFIGREELKRLRESTLITFFKVCTQYGIKRDKDFKYNGQDHYIQFANNSRIDLLDLRYLLPIRSMSAMVQWNTPEDGLRKEAK